MSEKNQVVAASTAIANAIDWDNLDLQAIITAGNQGFLTRPLTNWLLNKRWIKTQLTAHNVFKDKETYLKGDEFLRRAKEIPGWQNGSQKAYKYYEDPAHWAEIPKGVDVIVFANAEFVSGSNRHALFLYRSGTQWYGAYFTDNRFDSRCRVAVPDSVPEVS